MHRIKAIFKRFSGSEHGPLAVLLAVMLVLHLGAMFSVPEPVFDEGYYVPAARAVLHGERAVNAGHPPLGQLLITLGMRLFGDNPFGWRVFSVFFGMTSLVLFYLICRELKLTERVAFLAVFLLSIESLSFYLGSIAMLDVFSITFMLAAFLSYLRGKDALTGVLIALSALAKLSGAFALLAILLHWVVTNRKDVRRLLIVSAVSAASFLLLLPVLELPLRHTLVNPLARAVEMLASTRSATFAEYALNPSGVMPTRPWDWLLRLNGTAALDVSRESSLWYVRYYLLINPAVWAFIIPVTIFSIVQALKRKPAYIFIACWFAGTYLIWIPASLLTDRISYDYYFYPTVGAVCLGIAGGIHALVNAEYRRPSLNRVLYFLSSLYLLAAIIFFAGLCPGNIWLKASLCVVLYALVRYTLDHAGWPVPTSAQQPLSQ